jgi:hypothetical protein
MTLTTHGTEYFRDPEMVRQALRGVKVHQVNGAKFDIYAAGAVLYFVLENTFPAHGGLSRFTRNSPEALRWIVKRAMAEYNQRYETVEMMLADLEIVTNADDPFAVKLSALPSMRSGARQVDDLDVEIKTESPQAAQVAAACSPFPPRGASGDWRNPRPDDRQSSSGVPRRPKLRIMDWFTGKYAVEDPGSATGAADGSAFAARSYTTPRSKDDWKRQKKQFKEDMKRFKHDMHDHADAIRRSARDQLASARARVRGVQSRVARRRHAVGVERQPSPAVTATTLIILAVIFMSVWHWPSNNAGRLPIVGAWLESAGNASDASPHVVTASTTAGGLPVLTVLDVERELEPVIFQHQQYVDLVERYERDGHHVLSSVGPDPDELRRIIRQWRDEPTGEISESLESILAEHDLYGFLVIRARTGAGGSIEQISGSVIQSNDPAAKERRWPHVPADAINDPPQRPFLLINDHPARTDSRVVDRITHQLKLYEARGWTIITDDDAEVAVRKVMPAGGPQSLNAGEALPQRLQSVLSQHELGGILLITAPPGDAPPHERIAVMELAAK